VELSWLGGGDVPPGSTPQLAARLPWLQRAAAADGGGGGAGSGKTVSRTAGSGKAWASSPPAAAAALWEAAAALAGVEAGRTKLPPRRGLAPLPPAPRLPPFAPRTPLQDDGGGDVEMPAVDPAAASDAAGQAAQVLIAPGVPCTSGLQQIAGLETTPDLRWHDMYGPACE
jgi:hypothetical protein